MTQSEPLSMRNMIAVSVASSIFGIVVGSVPGALWVGRIEQRVTTLEAQRIRDDVETSAWRNRYDDKLDANRKDSATEHAELLRRLEEVARGKR